MDGARDRNRTGTSLSGLGILSLSSPLSKTSGYFSYSHLEFSSVSIYTVLRAHVSSEWAEFGQNLMF
jgi:hypothetical protein